MKITFLITLFLFSTTLAFSQSAFISEKYGFGFKVPDNFEVTHDYDSMKPLQAYICPPDKCSVFGVFIAGKAETVQEKLPVVDVVRQLQKKSTLEYNVKKFLEGADSVFNFTILNKYYIAIQGVPGNRIEFNFTYKDLSFTGAATILYFPDRQVVCAFMTFSLDSLLNKWNPIADGIFNSLTTDIKTLNNLPKKGGAFTIGRMDDEPPAPRPLPAFPKKVSLGVLNGKATRLVSPPYPPAAKAVHADGAVNVQVSIDEDGNVISAKAVSGHPLLLAAAEAAALQSKFSPTLLQGRKVSVSGVLVYNFVAP